jgi:multidrug efflux pump subunit AcrA (membrane-fusion protein)
MTMLGHPSAAEGPGLGTMPGPLDGDDASPPSTKRRRRWPKVVGVLVVVLLAAGGAAWYVAAHHHGSTTPTADATTRQVVPVTTGTITDSVTAQGTVAAQDTQDLNFSSAGTVTAVKVKVGDAVKAGQTLATIDSKSLVADLVSAGATRDQAAAKLSDDQAADASEAQLGADLSSLAVAQDGVAQAWAALAGASLVSPINGTITAVNLTAGEQLASNGTGGTSLTGSRSGSGASSSSLGSSQGQGGGGNQGSNSSNSSTPQIEVVSTGKFEVELAVGSADVAKIKDGQTATLTVSTSGSNTNTGAGAFAGRIPGGFFGNGGGFGGSGGGLGGNGQTTTRNGATGANGGFGGFGQGGNGATTGQNGSGRNGTGQNGAGQSQNGAGQNGQNGNGLNGQNGTGRRQAAAGTVVTGKVTDVSKIATASNGVANYTVTVDFTGDPTKVFIGSSVTGDIATAQHSGLLVPVRAVTTSAQGPTVMVALDGTANGQIATQAVTTGATSGGMIEVTSGLQAGENVIVEVPARLGTFGGNFPFGGQGANGQGANGEGGINQAPNATKPTTNGGGSGG